MGAVTHHLATVVLVALFLVLFDVFIHLLLEGYLQHLSSPLAEEFLQIRLHLLTDYTLHLNCRIFSHERILSPSITREL